MFRILSVLVLLFVSIQLSAQKKSDFNIEIPDVKVEDSKYNRLHYIESRPEPDNMGIVYVNKWHGHQSVTLHTPLDKQFDTIIQVLTDSTLELKTLALQLRSLNFGVSVDKYSDKEMCKIRITLYEQDNENDYYFLSTLDTIVYSPYKGIRKEVSRAIVSFISENLLYHAYDDEMKMDLEKISNIDMYEKNSIPFFQNEQIPDGIYYNYSSLKKLIPDEVTTISIVKGKEKEKKLKEVKIPDTENQGKDKKLKAKEAYAVVKDGVPYISFKGDFYEAYFDNGNWFFTIVQKVAGSGFSLGIGIGVGGSNAAGSMGVGIPIGSKKENVDIYIDHLNGEFY